MCVLTGIRCGTWGAGWVKNLSVGICDGAPSTAHSSLSCVFFFSYFLSFLFCYVFFHFSRDVPLWLFYSYLALYLIFMDSFLYFTSLNNFATLQNVLIIPVKHTSMPN